MNIDPTRSSLTHLSAAPATISEIGEHGPRVIVLMGYGEDDVSAFMLVTTDVAREIARDIADAADSADRGNGLLLPPMGGGRA